MDELSLYLRPRPRYAVFVLTASCCLLLFASWLTGAAYRNHLVAEVAQRHASVLQKTRVKRPPPKLSQSERDLQKHWTALKMERNFVWQPIFSALERSASRDIELLEFDPDKVSRQLTLSGEAKDEQALVDFLNALTAQPLFSKVHLTHQQKKIREHLETIAFELKASLNDEKK